jgi:hypothetical protein
MPTPVDDWRPAHFFVLAHRQSPVRRLRSSGLPFLYVRLVVV